ncbi:Peptidase family S41 [Pustulibacterium marinum]|uniref:Peptidase family S41 n=1 Tax=Pustulibacterium marinum TaxID=1224947 RepID=A0A1I7G9J7_9FLAO|nr:S41 family peptidase [Pustulibacterium marinum]SFU45123.1 Peptidase family S41 [Pustulibacterium marinum]
MIKKYLTLLLIFGVNSLFSQEKKCNCLNELDNTSKLIENAKSYKVQIKKGGREIAFKKWKEEIKQEIVNDSLSNYFCTGYLQKYISFIKDRHNEVYSIPNNISENVPNYTKKIDTTLNITDKISGIYYAGSDEILVKKENDSIWYGITLKSNSDEWTKGKIRLRINKTKNDKFELFEFYKNGLLYYQKNIKIANGRINSTFWNKQNNYYFNKNFEENFTFKSLNPSFNYIGIKTLSRTNRLMKEADIFYENHLDKLNKENLIIDLRNNGGGSINQAKLLLKALRKNDEIDQIYVLINFKTASAAELTTLKLKEDKRTIIVGENSRGMLEYGYGNNSFSTKTECSEFKVVLSTKHTSKRLGKYEYIGITPDLLLNNNSDWIDQIINGNSEKK